MKKNNLLLTGLFCACLFALSCKKAEVLQPEEKTFSINKKLATTNIITQSRNVNIVYFVPNDLDTR